MTRDEADIIEIARALVARRVADRRVDNGPSCAHLPPSSDLLVRLEDAVDRLPAFYRPQVSS